MLSSILRLRAEQRGVSGCTCLSLESPCLAASDLVLDFQLSKVEGTDKFVLLEAGEVLNWQKAVLANHRLGQVVGITSIAPRTSVLHSLVKRSFLQRQSLFLGDDPSQS